MKNRQSVGWIKPEGALKGDDGPINLDMVFSYSSGCSLRHTYYYIQFLVPGHGWFPWKFETEAEMKENLRHVEKMISI